MGLSYRKKMVLWKELNLRGHVPKHVDDRYPTPGFVGESFSALSCLSLHAHHLTQRVHHIHQIPLRFHHGIDRLVRHRSYVDDVRVLTALDAGSCLGMIVQREAALRFRTRHGASGSMATAHEAFRIALAAHDVRTRAHTARDDAHVSLASTHCALAGDEHVLAIVVLPGHVVV